MKPPPPAPSPQPARDSAATVFATALYRGLLHLYPAAFRERHGEEMLLFFSAEWQRASALGVFAQVRFAAHVLSDTLRNAPAERVAGTPRVAVLAIVASLLATRYLAVGPLPLWLKFLGCAMLTSLFAVTAVGASPSGRPRLWQLALVSLPLGLALAWSIHLEPRLIPAPATPLIAVTDPTITGPSIYARMRATYSAARSYADEGEQQTVFTGFSRSVADKPFRTAYVRDLGFRFEFDGTADSGDDHYVIWQDGAAIHHWWSIVPGVATEKDFNYALSAAAGVSSGTSSIVPQLLPLGVKSGLLSDPRAEIVLEGRQVLDGRDTFRLTVATPLRPVATIWVDAHTYLITRISSRSSLPHGIRTESTIVYHPRLNETVAASALTFQPGPTPVRWRTFFGGQTYAMILANLATFLAVLLNATHRRLTRGPSRGWAWRFARFNWANSHSRSRTAIYRRRVGETIAVTGAALGMWLGGASLIDALQILLLASFSLQAVAALQAIQRRSRAHARLALAR